MNGLDRSYLVLERVLDFTAARARALAQNVAAQSVPGYRRVDVDFGALVEALHAGDARRREFALVRARPEVVVDPTAPAGPNGNNVNADQELTQLLQVALLQEIAAQVAAGRTQTLRLAIHGRSS